ncbi:transcriptional regulator [Streptococcus pneumoniae]|nr:transcriptional regulator [Streptococcus pneumoniae]
MKLRIEIDGNLEETEIVIKTPTLTDEIADLQRLLQESKAPRLTFYKGTGEYYLDLSEILFFETEGSKIYAHNQKEAYEVRLKLYELESILPRYFNRVSKSTIANIRQIYSVDKSFSGTGTISFYQTHKEVHVSRHYQDNAEMLGDFATLNIEVAFGNATVYVPQHWRVDLKVETSFGAAKADAPVAPTSKTLTIRGDVAFGKLEIVYVK